jgi:hypothetical protein
MAHGAWRMAHGAWRMAHGAWRMAHGAWRMAQRCSGILGVDLTANIGGVHEASAQGVTATLLSVPIKMRVPNDR